MNPIGVTARWVAAARAWESRRGDHLLEDPFAEEFAGTEGFESLRRMDSLFRNEGAMGQINTFVIARTCFMDERLLAALKPRTIRQVVILAAGFDARAFRLKWPRVLPVYELDQPEILEAKERILTRRGAVAQCDRRRVPVDLLQPWEDKLKQAGFDPKVPSAWVVEGLTPYVEEQGVRKLLDTISSLSAPRSWMVCDMTSATILKSPMLRTSNEIMKKIGAPWIFGTDTPEDLLAEYGWKAEVTDPADYGRALGRWPYPPGPPRLSFLIEAERR